MLCLRELPLHRVFADQKLFDTAPGRRLRIYRCGIGRPGGGISLSRLPFGLIQGLSSGRVEVGSLDPGATQVLQCVELITPD